MADDFRLRVGFLRHPKTRRLKKRLGAEAVLCLEQLIEFCATTPGRSVGDFSGMEDEEIEIAADWDGEDGALVDALVVVRFMDGEEGERRLHDFEEHNPWVAGSDRRREQSRNASEVRWGKRSAKPKVAEGIADPDNKGTNSNAQSMLPACDEQCSEHAVSNRPFLSDSFPFPFLSDSVSDSYVCRGAPAPTRQKPDTQIPGEETLSKAKKRTLAAHRDEALRLWALQDELRATANPGADSLKATAERLCRVAERLAAGATPQECEAVLRRYAAEARANPESMQWFDGTTNWRPANFDRALGKAGTGPPRNGRMSSTQATVMAMQEFVAEGYAKHGGAQ